MKNRHGPFGFKFYGSHQNSKYRSLRLEDRGPGTFDTKNGDILQWEPSVECFVPRTLLQSKLRFYSHFTFSGIIDIRCKYRDIRGRKLGYTSIKGNGTMGVH